MTIEAPPPENIGDIYLVHGYPWSGASTYGAAYPAIASFHSGRWCWALQMADGDNFSWPFGADMPGMPCDSIELVRRNPLPQKE